MALPLPAWVSRIQNGGNKLAASRINDIQKPRRKVTINGQNQTLPIVYGRNQLSGGFWAATPVNDGVNDIYAVSWAWQECEEIEALYINGELSSTYAGVTVTHYLGTETQTADPTLAANIAGYADDLKGVVYSVIVIPVGTSGIASAPQFSVTMKGRKVYDPRTGLTQYSTNTALCLANFISSTVYGEGKTVVGIEECANFCDEEFNGVKRCQLGLDIRTPRKSREWTMVIGEYAECFVIEEGDEIRIKPDTKEAVSKFITDDDVVGNISVNVGSITNSPTVVEFRYTKPLGGVGAWPQPTITREFPDVGGGVGRVLSSVVMEGVFTEDEANRKAESRLRRGQLSTTYSYEGFDVEVLTQVGDVILLLSDRQKIIQEVRVTGVELIDIGRYRVHCSRYDEYAYPDSVTPPASTGQIQEGMILPMLSGLVPAGWSEFAAANDKYLLGSNGAGAGVSGGSATIDINGTTTINGAHSGNIPFYVRKSSEPGVNEFYPVDDAQITTGDHAHTYSKTGVVVQPLSRESKLIIKGSGSVSFIPNNCGVFSNQAINSPDIDQVSTFIGRVFKAASDWANTGAQSKIEYITTAANGGHNHGLSGDTLIPYPPSNNFDYLQNQDHTHQLTATITPKMLRHRLYMYSGAEDFTVQPGMIVATTLTSSFAGWVDCDGTNDTPDLNGKYIEFASGSNIDTTTGDNTVSVSGLTDTRNSHNHVGSQISPSGDPYEPVLTYHSENSGDHDHAVNDTFSYTAPFYTVRFLMYTGA